MPLLLSWAPLAVAHLRNAYEYIAEDNQTAAEAVLAKIFAGVERLEHYPQMGRPGRVQNMRELVIPGTPFVVAYRVLSGRVEILAVLHASRKWPEKL